MLGFPPPSDSLITLANWQDQTAFVRQIDADAKSDESMHLHHRWAQSMALIQIAIALAAITLLTRQKWLQWMAYGAGIGSLVVAAFAFAHI